MTDPTPPIPAQERPRMVTMEDVHRTLGAMLLEIEMLRRENAQLRMALQTPPAGSRDGPRGD